MLPEILNDITQYVNILSGNTLEKQAILNVFMAKFCSVIASKQIMTSSIRHQELLPLSYYGLNLMPSGTGKNVVLSIVNNLFDWYDNILKHKNEQIANEEIQKIEAAYSSKKSNSKQKDLCNIFQFDNCINGASAPELYRIACKIDEYQFGSLFFCDTEFFKKFEKTNVYDNVIDLLFNLYDGVVDYNKIKSEQRYNLKSKISTSTYFATAYENLLDADVHKAFKKYGDSGLFRRTYIYFLQFNEQQQYVQPSIEEVMQQKQKTYSLLKALKQIYENVVNNGIYEYDDDANECIDQYCYSIQQYISKNLNYNDILFPTDVSLKIDLQGSFWKIIKTSFLLHILRDPQNLKVSSLDVQNAIDYYNMFSGYLEKFLRLRPISKRTIIKALICKNLNKTLSREQFLQMLRNEIFDCVEYDEWNDLQKNLIQNIIQDVKNEQIYCEEKENTIKFYKIKNNC